MGTLLSPPCCFGLFLISCSNITRHQKFPLPHYTDLGGYVADQGTVFSSKEEMKRTPAAEQFPIAEENPVL